MQAELFDLPEPEAEPAPEGLHILRGFAVPQDKAVLAAVAAIAAAAPFRRMTTPGGQAMSAAMTSCGAWGWVSDRRGYRYQRHDPQSGLAWPVMPKVLQELAISAAAQAGFAFAPDSCLINLYEPGARMGLHQDRDEPDDSAPIVSLSLGLPVMFLWGGMRRQDPVRRVELRHGDVAVWGGAYRRAYHGVAALKAGQHAVTGARRINLTFRKAI
ncbi:DNA oxidative demethylase AlkB [Asticcacaulis sp. EMRT-3]|uniref:DNA oxidative demethylase AlkB n=1 Tax=Asticcacaulis sp. EMRT-3 TaxID=3040349 RepID=UPI0024AE8C3E|nr:DNA oxidative demethylase AlkB [Asticcacaulis sp. EMRT-3]MDI7775064.1 DNA oxidative demethylase AlkB [Asticcacaulis sp. EMRT-3]